MIPRLVCILSNNPSPFFFFPHKIELGGQLHKECERVKVRLNENIARFATRAWKRARETRYVHTRGKTERSDPRSEIGEKDDGMGSRMGREAVHGGIVSFLHRKVRGKSGNGSKEEEEKQKRDHY